MESIRVVGWCGPVRVLEGTDDRIEAVLGHPGMVTHVAAEIGLLRGGEAILHGVT
jgi:hypothetical protein